MKTRLALAALLAALTMPAFAHAAEIDWKKVDAALGKSAVVSGDVHRYGLPRSDLKVTLDGVAIKPALALGAWANDDALKLARGVRAALEKTAIARS